MDEHPDHFPDTEHSPPNNSHRKNLSRQVFKGGQWVFAFKIVQRLFNFIKIVILARLLSPHDFGLLGLALLTIGILDTFSQTGFGPALIQRKDNIKDYLDVSWSVTIIRGLFLFVILFAISSRAAIFFKAPEATLIIQIVGLSIVFKSLTNVGVVYFQKEMQFRKHFYYELSALLADFFVAVPAALILKNAWALVLGCLASNIARMIMSYIVHPYRPRFKLDLKKAKELFGFGIWVWGSSILFFLVTQGDDIFVGKLLGVAALGLYQTAYRISNIGSTEIADLISQVTFPAYSKLQDHLAELRDAYLKTLQFTVFISIPVAGLVFSLAPEFTKIFLGTKWLPIVPVMEVLAFVGLMGSIAATAVPVFLATKNPGRDTRWRACQLLVLAAFIYPLSVQWGIQGTAMSVLLSVMVMASGFIMEVTKITQCGFSVFFQKLIYPLTSSVFMIIAIIAAKTIIPSGGVFQFLGLALIGVVTYLLTSYLFDRLFNYGIVQLIKNNFIRHIKE